MSDHLVPLVTLAGAVLATVWLARRGVCGRQLVGAGASALFGTFLIAAMTAHNVEVAYGWLARHPDTLDFRTYGLLLLGGVLTVSGIALWRAIPGVSRADLEARQSALRAISGALLVTAPLLAVHPFFGLLVTTLGLGAGLAVAVVPARPMGSAGTDDGTPTAPPAEALSEAEAEFVEPVVLVVGANARSRTLCRTLLDAGATVYVTDASLDVASRLAVELGSRAYVVPLNPATEIGWQIACGFLRAEHGGVDLVLRCDLDADELAASPPEPALIRTAHVA